MKHANFFSTSARLLTIAAFATSALFMTSCDEDPEPEPEPTETIWEILSGNTALSQVTAILDTAGMEATLSGAGEYTLFAPDNTAFVNLLATPGFPQDIYSINPAIIANVLAYHLVDGEYSLSDLTNNLEIASNSAGAEKIKVIVTAGVVTLRTGSSNQNIEIKTSNIRATNGTIHIVESVMIPPTVGAALTPILGTNAGTLLLGAPFSTLATCIAKADEFAAGASIPTLTSILAGANAHTVFAPTNETFVAGGITAATYTGQQWYGIIANHVVMSNVLPAQLVSCAEFFTALGGLQKLVIFNNTAFVPAQNGLGIYIDSNQDVVCDLSDLGASLNKLNAEVVVANAAENTNGRIHVIAGVLAPKQ